MCTSPLAAFKGDGAVVFDPAGPLRLPCGQCTECRLERSRQWAIRCMHESKMHERNCFITLTYDAEHLPSPPNLDYSHFSAFIKRLRSSLRYKVINPDTGRPKTVYPVVRFYMCGEYGEENGRPHYHACIFGHDFDDRVIFRTGSSGFPSFTSEKLSKLWPYGNAWCGDFSFETAGYCARYIMKKLLGAAAMMAEWSVDLNTGEIYRKVFEFTQMSRDPGIGKPFYDKYKSEIYPHDRVVIRGKAMKPPRYYKRILKREDEVKFLKIEEMHKKCIRDRIPEQAFVRRVARDKVVKARLSMLVRKEI